ncbi:MAG: glutamate--tRNA ligase [Candidatus Micrarchaeota archaeon]|nr:glutamate--tRNA ligase [Candidatus Micrarchaeota archaeon]
MDLQSVIRKHALKNAFDFGKASSGSVVGKVIGEFPDAKSDMKTTMQKITETINEVNSLSKEQIETELKNYIFAEKPKEEKKALQLPNAEEGKVITRFPPEPSGYPHIGHAKAAYLDYESAKQHSGHMVLRFDDTNPEKESQEYVDAIKEGLNWLGVTWEKETYTSDNMERIYSSAEKLISRGKAYICTCKQEIISKLRAEMKACACRELPIEKVFERWEIMLAGKYKVGQAIVRFKGDLSSLNTVMRDPMLARLINITHYRQGKKYQVWPGYDLAVVVMDNIEGITHPMRTKEYELRNELYYSMVEILEFKKPTLIEFSRLDIKNAPISKRLLAPLVKEKKVLGWDDPRLPTLAGLKRRGILPQAIKNFVMSFGLSKVESEPGWEALLVENKKLLDPVAKHYFFVTDPVKLSINIKGEVSYVLKASPRKTVLNGKVYLPKTDTEKFAAGEVIALKDLAFAKFDGKKLEKVEQENIPEKKVQWVNPDDCIACDILVPKDLFDGEVFQTNSLEIKKGYCESVCNDLNIGDVIQFERFGFCRLDKKTEKKLTFIFSC